MYGYEINSEPTRTDHEIGYTNVHTHITFFVLEKRISIGQCLISITVWFNNCLKSYERMC